MKLTKRIHTVVDVARLDEVAYKYVSALVIRFGDKLAFDISALCYKDRASPSAGDKGVLKEVDESSLDVKRVRPLSHVARWYKKCAETARYDAKSLKTISLRQIRFMDWADKSGYSDVLYSKPAAEEALAEYFHMISTRGERGEIGLLPARRLQAAAREMICAAHGESVGAALKLVATGYHQPEVRQKKPDQAAKPKKKSLDEKWSLRKSVWVGVNSVEQINKEYVPGLIVELDDNVTLDFGAFCYRSRLTGLTRTRSRVYPVEEASLDMERAGPVHRLAIHACQLISTGWSRQSSVVTMMLRYFQFLNFCDQEGYLVAMLDHDEGKRALTTYFMVVAERCRRHEISKRHCRELQLNARTLLSVIFDDDDFASELVPMSARAKNGGGTPAPDEEEHGKVLALSQALFDGFFDISCKSAGYPYCLQLPKYLPWPHHHIWIFSKKNWFTKFLIPGCEHVAGNGHFAYVYQEGRLRTEAEAEASRSPSHARQVIRAAQIRLDEANADPRDPARMRAASTAHNMFFLLFTSNTGMNFTDARELTWTDEYEVTTERQQFRTIKWRAGGKECKFEIELGFLPVFKKFIELRKFMLNGKQSDFLFISLGRKMDCEPRKIGASFFQLIYDTLRLIDPTIKSYRARALRAAKANFVIENADANTGAALLQNNETTFLRNYTAGSETKHMQQFSAFYDALANAVSVVLDDAEKASDIVTGKCSDMGNPVPLNEGTPIPVDCGRSEGCMFCQSYRIHADSEDARKLLSCRQYLDFIVGLARDKEEVDRVFMKIFARIEGLLALIEERSPGVVDAVREEVEEGRLTTYWEAKIELLRNCGAI